LDNASVEKVAWRHTAFLEMAQVERPLLGFWLGDYYFTSQFPTARLNWPAGVQVLPESLHFEQFAGDYEQLHQAYAQVDDDFFLVSSAYPVVPWMEAIAGCQIFAEETSFWAKAWLDDYRQLTLLADQDISDSPWFRKLVELTASLVAFSDGRFPVSPPLMRGPADMLAAMRGASQFVLDFADHRSEVTEALALCTRVRMQVMQALSELIPPFHGGYAAGGYPTRLWTPGKRCLYNQEDAAAVLSPRIYRSVLLPLEKQIAGQADVAFMHLHSSCVYPVDILLADPSYQVIQINYDHAGTGPRLDALMPTLQKVIAQKPLLLWGEFDIAEITSLIDSLGSRGLSLQPIVPDLESAHRLREQVDRLTRR
jgi:hypothetical protein